MKGEREKERKRELLHFRSRARSDKEHVAFMYFVWCTVTVNVSC